MAALRVEVVYALPGEQTVVAVELGPGATVSQAIIASGVLERHPEIDLAAADLGVWGERVGRDYCVSDGDRIEIYRPLIADPKTMRRQRVRKAGSQKRRQQN